MAFDGDFDDGFGDIEFFTDRFFKRFQAELNGIIQGIKNGKINGRWEIRQLDEPEMDGYIVHGRFETSDPLEPLEPRKRRPMPERPFGFSKAALKENAEPLVDVFEKDNAVKIYAEMPGEEKRNINLNVTENRLEIKTPRTSQEIELPNRDLDTDEMASEYKNGVLEITIPKKETDHRKHAWKARMV